MDFKREIRRYKDTNKKRSIELIFGVRVIIKNEHLYKKSRKNYKYVIIEAIQKRKES